MEDVEDVIVSSGPNTWPNWRNFSDRIISPATSCSWIWPRSPGTATSPAITAPIASARSRLARAEGHYATALGWLYDSIEAVKAAPPRARSRASGRRRRRPGATPEEDQAAANLWGHGLGLAQYDPPVISRIWSLDHPLEIKAGMTFRPGDAARQALPLRRAHRGDAHRADREADPDRDRSPTSR
jgi:Xaa-Pro aminopeptidase